MFELIFFVLEQIAFDKCIRLVGIPMQFFTDRLDNQTQLKCDRVPYLLCLNRIEICNCRVRCLHDDVDEAYC